MIAAAVIVLIVAICVLALALLYAVARAGVTEDEMLKRDSGELLSYGGTDDDD